MHHPADFATPAYGCVTTGPGLSGHGCAPAKRLTRLLFEVDLELAGKLRGRVVEFLLADGFTEHGQNSATVLRGLAARTVFQPRDLAEEGLQ